jgi:photosystem II stability/assembly factor-like uncharacterized protein
MSAARASRRRWRYVAGSIGTLPIAVLITSGASSPTTAEEKARASSIQYDEDEGMWRERLEFFYSTHRAPPGVDPDEALRAAIAFARKMPLARNEVGIAALQSVTGDRWVSVGPAPIVGKFGRKSTGRVRAIVVDPADPTGNTIYIGAATGGVWKTTDGGQNWSPKSDFEDSLAIETIAVDPQDHLIVYAGTGEHGRPGWGVLKSTDGGEHWTTKGVDPNQILNSIVHKLALVPGTLAHPAWERVILAATERGLGRSDNGGGSWQFRLFSPTTDVVIDPHNPSIAYAAVAAVGIYRSDDMGYDWTQLTDANNQLPVSGFRRINLAIARNDGTGIPTLFASFEDTTNGENLKGIWKSSDNGAHWTRVTGHPRQFADGQWATPNVFEVEPNGDTGSADALAPNEVIEGTISSNDDVDFFRVSISGNDYCSEVVARRAGSALDPVLTVYDSSGKQIGRGDGSLGSQDNPLFDERVCSGGWQKIAPGQYFLRVESKDHNSQGRYQLSVIGHDLWCQCDYDQMIAVDPQNPNIIYSGTIKLARTTDGGVNWTQIHEHGDNDNWVHADVHTLEFDPTDPQVLYVGADGGVYKTTNRGDNWFSLNRGLALSQIYPGVSQSPTDPDFVLLGLQDNASARRRFGDWQELQGGDGGYTAIANPQVWYVSAQGLTIYKTTNDGASFGLAVNGLRRDDLGIDAPFVMAPYDSNVMLAGGRERISGGSPHFHVHRTTNGGGQWSEISPDLENGIRTLAFAPSDANVYYVGTNNGELWRTSDAGGHWWTTVLFPLQSHPVTRIAVDRWNSQRLFLSVGDFGVTHIWGSTDGGASFTALDAGLPNAPFNVIVIDPNYPNTLFAGGDAGVFRSTDAGSTWQRFGLGLPNVPVTDIVISPNAGSTGSMIVATYGRGLWELRPGNDICEAAEPVGDGTIHGSTRGAERDGSSSCGNAYNSPDVWFLYTPACDGDLWLDTCNADYEAVVSLHTPGCPGNTVTERLCAEDCTAGSCGGTAACVKTKVVAGDQQLVRVSGSGGATGDFDLHALCRVPNESCAEASTLAVGSFVDAGTRGATTDGAPTCNGIVDQGPGVWYTVVGTGKVLTASTCFSGTTYDSALSVYCVGCGELRCVAANDDAGCGTKAEVSWCSEQGQIYRILVHGWQQSSGPFRLLVSENEPCSSPPGCSAANDHCESGLPIGTGLTWGSSWGSDTDTVVSCSRSNGDVWYHWTPACNGVATIDTCATGGTLNDSVLSVHDTCGGTELNCNNNDPAGACGSRSKIIMGHTADRPLDLRVASWGSADPPGTFPLTIASSTTNPVAPLGGFYVASGTGPWAGNLVRIDIVNRTSWPVGPLGVSFISGLAWASDLGILYGIADDIDNARLVEIDPATGAATPLGFTGYGGVRGLAYASDRGKLYATGGGGADLLELDPLTGAGRLVGPIGFSRVEGLAYNPLYHTLYGSDTASDRLIVINPSTGAGTAIGSFGGDFGEIDGLAFHEATQTLYGAQSDQAASQVRIVMILTTTGEAFATGEAFDYVTPLGLDVISGLPRAYANTPYDATIPASGGCPPYVFTDVAGLPNGLTADAHGRITGAPTDVGTYAVTYDVEDTSFSTPWSSGSKILRVNPGNDECTAAHEVGYGRPHVFTTINATTDGPDEPDICSWWGDTQVASDVWFCHEAPCTGTLNVSVCSSDYDTKLAVYSDCDCSFLTTQAIACNDDACGTQSELDVEVTAGYSYGIRIGGYGGASGSGSLELTCSGPGGGACCLGGGCAIRTPVGCDSEGGIPRGVGTDCDSDSDGDALADVCDGCPSDPMRTAPGPCGCDVIEYDMDGDGSPDCIDDDLDGDRVPNAQDADPVDPYACRDEDADICDDCASGIDDPTADGVDADRDGYCTMTDCHDGYADLWRTPGAAGNLRVRADRATLWWDPPSDPGCAPSMLFYDTLRSNVAWDFDAFATCIEWDDGPDTHSYDGMTPVPGAAFFYLVRAENLCGAGPLGQRSDGMIFYGRDCP